MVISAKYSTARPPLWSGCPWPVPVTCTGRSTTGCTDGFQPVHNSLLRTQTTRATPHPATNPPSPVRYLPAGTMLPLCFPSPPHASNHAPCAAAWRWAGAWRCVRSGPTSRSHIPPPGDNLSSFPPSAHHSIAGHPPSAMAAGGCVVVCCAPARAAPFRDAPCTQILLVGLRPPGFALFVHWF